MAVSSAAARRYAAAIIDIAADANKVDQVTSELERFAAAFTGAPDLANVLTNPVFGEADRTATLDAVMEKLVLSETVRRFLKLVNERRRMIDISGIAEAARKLADERGKRVRALIESAGPLSADATAKLKAALEQRTGRSVDMDIKVDPSLLGGIRTTIGSQVFDGTIRTQLEGLRDNLQRGEA